MFSSSSGPGNRATPTGIYREVGASTVIEGADAHKLVSVLYQAVSDEIAAARGALRRADVHEKGRAIGHAARIVEEGLRAPLDMVAGGVIARTLDDLYQYIVYRLTVANLKSDDAMLAECARLLESMEQAWQAIAYQVAPQAHVPGTLSA